MAHDFKGRTIVVTGAGAGIGKAIAQKLSESGAKVVGLSLVQAEVEALSREFPSIKAIKADVTDWNGVQKVIDGLGVIHGLVNNAGVAITAPFLDISEDHVDKTMAVNVKGIIAVSQAVARSMIANNVQGGAIVNVSSIAALKALAEHTVYCGSKAAVDGVTRVMSLELAAPHRIRVNAVNPTVVLTELGQRVWGDAEKKQGVLRRIPLGHFAEVHNVVDAVTYLLSDRASMVNGVCMRVDGGYGAS